MSLQSPMVPGRAPVMLVLFLLLTLLLFVTSCKRSGVGGEANANQGAANQSAAANETSTTPPFSTKEPDRYQATMVITGSFGGASGVQGASATTNREIAVARDGQNRRVDTEPSPGMKVSFLQTAAGSYILMPEQKVYAEFNMGGNSSQATPDFSPDKLLNQVPGGARYEKLGTEQINGRATTKYRVTLSTHNNDAQNETAESLIWIDDALGMPVKSETSISGSNASKYSMEVRDIKEQVDPSLFELPADYKKVDYRDIIRQMMSSEQGNSRKD